MNSESPKRVLYTVALPLAIVMLIFWAVMTFAFSGPGWVHIFLTAGVFLLIWRVVAGGTESAWQRYVRSEKGEHVGTGDAGRGKR